MSRDDIEYAIAFIETLKRSYVKEATINLQSPDWGTQLLMDGFRREFFDTTLTILREAMGRIGGCAACLDFAGMVRSDNYCFKCGRKLKEEKQ